MFTELVSSSPEPARILGVDDWWTSHRRLCTEHHDLFERSVIAGFHADRLGYAFASGYVEAVQHLLGPRGSGGCVVLCASEEKGAHPSAIRTHISREGDGGFRIAGTKKWATLGPLADSALVIASRGVRPDGKNDLVAVLIPTDRSGVRITEMPPLSFVPEIPHATLDLDDVRVEGTEVLEGDAYVEVLKPFRTIEDIFVHGALSGWLIQIARRASWPPSSVEDLLASIAGLGGLLSWPPLAPSTHRALAGLITLSEQLLERFEPHWSTVDAETRMLWLRDRPILHVASKAREKRRQAAREQAGSEA